MFRKELSVPIGSFRDELQATREEFTALCKTLARFLAKKTRRGLRMSHRGNAHVRCPRGELWSLASRCAPETDLRGGDVQEGSWPSSLPWFLPREWALWWRLRRIKLGRTPAWLMPSIAVTR